MTSLLLDDLIALAEAAGRAILPHYEARAAATLKADGSPVTAADTAAEAIIVAGLEALTPDIPVVAEEMMAGGQAPRIGRRFWLVDPLDGTREFIDRTGEFTVNIGLVEDGVPQLGIVHAPVMGDSYAADRHRSIWRRPNHPDRELSARRPPDDGLVAVASRRHGAGDAVETFLAALPVRTRTAVGSSLKFCLIARGDADVYPRFGPTSEWDTAAGHAVLSAAGGRVTDLEGRPLLYGKPDFLTPGFVAWGAG